MDGRFLVVARAVTCDATFSGSGPSRGEAIARAFPTSTAEDVADACRLAASYEMLRGISPA